MARKGRRSSKDERINAIRLLEQGYTKVQVARIFNVTESSVYGWQKAYREGGLAALSTKIASGRKRLLTDKQMLELSGYLRLNPRQLEFNFVLCTRHWSGMRENGGNGWRKHFRPLRNAPRRRGRRSSSQMRRGAGPITTPGGRGRPLARPRS